MDMAILPNAGDYTSPVKLFEFMAAGIAPVAPDLEPIREVLEEDSTGWLFPANDLGAAVATVCDKARDPAALARIGAAAQAYVTAHRQWRNNVLQLLAFQRDLMAGEGACKSSPT
jgi:glycosyltransferase involved in cell wall biosynthesis